MQLQKKISIYKSNIFKGILLICLLLLINLWTQGQQLLSENKLESIAKSLIEAKSKEEQTQILEKNKDLITVALLIEMNKQALQIYRPKYEVGQFRIYSQANGKQILLVCDLIISLAEKLKADSQKSIALGLKASVTRAQGRYKQALEYYQEQLVVEEKIGNKHSIASTLFNVGAIYLKQDNYTQALAYFHKSLNVGEEIGFKSMIASSLSNIGHVYEQQRDFTQALKYLHKSLKLREDLGYKNRLSTSYLLNKIASIYSIQRNYVQALDYYHKVLKVEEEIGDKKRIASTLNRIGSIYSSQRNYTEALNYYHKSLKIREEIKDKEGMASALGSIKTLYFIQRNYTQALEYAHKSLKIKEEIGDKKGLAYPLFSIGRTYEMKGDYTKALEYFYKALKINEELGDKQRMASLLQNIASVYRTQRNYALAAEYRNRSRKIKEEIGDKSGNDPSFVIQVVVPHKGTYKQALERYHESLKMNEERGDSRGVAHFLFIIGNVHDRQGDYVQALDYYHKSLKINEEIGDKEDITMLLNAIGSVHNRQHNYAQALEYYNRSLKMKEEIGDKQNAFSYLHTIARMYEWQRNYTQALECYYKSLKLAEETEYKKGIAITFNRIGHIHLSQRNYEQALEEYNKSLKINEEIDNKEGIASTLENIAKIYNAQDQPKLALEYTSRASIIASQVNDLDTRWNNFFTAGLSYSALGKQDLARKAFLDSISVIEQLRLSISGPIYKQHLFFQDKVAPYHALVSLLINSRDYNQALIFAERAKARTLLDQLNAVKPDLTKQLSSDETEIDQKLSSELTSLNMKLSKENQKLKPNQTVISDLKMKRDKARLQYEDFQNKLYIAHPELRLQRGDISHVSLDDISTLIDQKSAILKYVVTEDNTYLFLLTPPRDITSKPQLDVYTLNINSYELDKIVSDFHHKVGQRDLGVRRPAQQLYNLLIKPAEDKLKGISHLCIVPDGSLWNLPFQSLDRDGKTWFIEDFSLSYAPSLSALREMRKKRKSIPESINTELLAFGNPTINASTIEKVRYAGRDEKFEPLQYAEKEVLTLSTLYGKDKSKVLTGADAKEEVVKSEAGKYRVLHFATHGVLDDKSPLYSRLMLASEDGAREDGMLEAWEIMRMNLNADMAVLAACETARGEISAGEGMVGMSWAMFVAGVPTTVASQWKVDSKATSQLMVEFHKNIKKNKSKAEALREASMLLMKTDYDHPYYWAGFIVIGDER
jgi:CHAT domain-containing protein/uncharacterized protein HemY